MAPGRYSHIPASFTQGRAFFYAGPVLYTLKKTCPNTRPNPHDATRPVLAHHAECRSRKDASFFRPVYHAQILRDSPAKTRCTRALLTDNADFQARTRWFSGTSPLTVTFRCGQNNSLAQGATGVFSARTIPFPGSNSGTDFPA